MGIRRYEITDEQWEQIKNMLPPEHPKFGKRGRPAKYDKMKKTATYSQITDTVINMNTTSNIQPSNDQLKVVKCKNCGANDIIISGELTKCEFCGSVLE